MPDYARSEVFAQRLRVALAAAGLSRASAAAQCGTSKGSMIRWAAGECRPPANMLPSLARATGASIDWLMWPEPVDVTTIPQKPDPRLTQPVASEGEDA